jgi:hypothetical protein
MAKKTTSKKHGAARKQKPRATTPGDPEAHRDGGG